MHKLGDDSPLAEVCLQVDDGLGALDITKSLAPHVKHVVGSLWEEATDVDIGLSSLILEAAIKGLEGRAGCRNSTRNRRLFMY